MANCKKCGKNIPARIKINGIYKSLQCRKYCLECSPYGKHNTKQIEKNSIDCKCVQCNKEYKYSRNKGHTLNICNSCHQQNRHYKLRKKLTDYKGGKCKICGYDKCLDALDFHHINPANKTMGIGSSWNRSYKILKQEADKCMLLCANCHREIHSK